MLINKIEAVAYIFFLMYTSCFVSWPSEREGDAEVRWSGFDATQAWLAKLDIVPCPWLLFVAPFSENEARDTGDIHEGPEIVPRAPSSLTGLLRELGLAGIPSTPGKA